MVMGGFPVKISRFREELIKRNFAIFGSARLAMLMEPPGLSPCFPNIASINGRQT